MQRRNYTFSEKLMCNLIVLYLDQLFPTSLVVNSKFRVISRNVRQGCNVRGSTKNELDCNISKFTCYF